VLTISILGFVADRLYVVFMRKSLQWRE